MLYLIGLSNYYTGDTYTEYLKDFHGKLNFTFFDSNTRETYTRTLTAGYIE